MKKIIDKKKKIILITIIILLILTSFFVIDMYLKKFDTYEQVKKQNNILQNNLDSLKTDLEQQKNLKQELQGGNIHLLHDPLYEEVVDFLKIYNSSYFNYTYKMAKENGIRCSIVEIILGQNGVYIFDCLAFDTVDKGLCYFETENGYELEPVIGKAIKDCIEVDIFGDIYFDDTIIDIFYIW